MVYRRFGPVYSRLLLSKQDELGRMEALLLAMDQTDLADGNGKYLMSKPLDVGREQLPEAWDGVSRVALLERMEKLALEYGMYCSLRTRLIRPCVLHLASFSISLRPNMSCSNIKFPYSSRERRLLETYIYSPPLDSPPSISLHLNSFTQDTVSC